MRRRARARTLTLGDGLPADWKNLPSGWSRGAAPPGGLDERVASAVGRLRRRNNTQGHVGVAKRAFRERVFMPHLLQERLSRHKLRAQRGRWTRRQ